MNSIFVDSMDVELNSAIEYLNKITSFNVVINDKSNGTRLFTNYPNPFNPIGLATGIYFYQLQIQTNLFTETKKMIYLK
jgi:hypothetical protein